MIEELNAKMNSLELLKQINLKDKKELIKWKN